MCKITKHIVISYYFARKYVLQLAFWAYFWGNWLESMNGYKLFYRKRGALTSTPLSIHHIMLKIKCGLVSSFDNFPVDDIP